MLTTNVMPLIHREGLLKLINDGIEQVPQTYRKIVPNTITSKQAYEQIQTWSGFGFFQPMTEAQGVTYDSVIPGYTKTYTPVIRTLGVKHTRQSLQKDLYGFVKSMAPLLAKSAVATKNLLAANILNLGFSAATMASPDGAALFSASHPIKQNGTTQSNLGADALSGLALEAAIQSVYAQKGDRGIPKYFTGGLKLVVGPALYGLATRAVESSGLQGTSDNDTNKFVSGAIREIVMEQFIGFGSTTMDYYWFLLPADSSENPLIEIEVQGLKTDTDYDMDFQATKFAASFECVFDNLGWRGLYASQV